MKKTNSWSSCYKNEYFLPGASQQRGWITAARIRSPISNKFSTSAALHTLRRRDGAFAVDKGAVVLAVDDVIKTADRLATADKLLPAFFRFAFVDFNLWKESFKSLSCIEVDSRVWLIKLDIQLSGWRVASRWVARFLSRASCCSRSCGKSLSVEEASLIPLSQEPSPFLRAARSADLRPRYRSASLRNPFLRFVSSCSNCLNFSKVSSALDMFLVVEWWHRSQRLYTSKKSQMIYIFSVNNIIHFENLPL